jgi:lipid-A-disaccharide synthase-like uncharacterized protein
LLSVEKIWLGVGFGAQILFSSRFLIQWLASEKAGRSIIPVSFWYLSLGGGLLLLSYAIWRRDPVFILGQSTGVFIYSRNIYMIIRERKKQKKLDSETASKSG